MKIYPDSKVCSFILASKPYSVFHFFIKSLALITGHQNSQQMAYQMNEKVNQSLRIPNEVPGKEVLYDYSGMLRRITECVHCCGNGENFQVRSYYDYYTSLKTYGV